LLFVIGHWVVDALRRAVLADDLASPSFGDPEPFAQHDHCGASTVRG